VDEDNNEQFASPHQRSPVKSSHRITPSESRTKQTRQEESHNINHIKNSDKQNLWFQKGISNRHTFPGLQQLDSEIQELLSITTDEWNTCTSHQGIHIFSIQKKGNSYIKTENLVNDNLHIVGNLLLAEQSARHWNPYLRNFECCEYSQDAYGVYDCLYEIKSKGQQYWIADKWLNVMWYHLKYFLVVRYPLPQEKSKNDDKANFR
jgi:hypothetical protein